MNGKNYLVNFTIKKLVFGIGVLFLLSILIFAILSVVPGTYFTSGITKGLSLERVQILNHIYGLDQPIYMRYINWLGATLQGDLGISFTYKKPVVDVLLSGVLYSFAISLFALILELLIAIPLGIFSAISNSKVVKKLIAFVTLLLISVPVFFVGIILKKWVSFDLGLLPASGFYTVGADYTGIQMVGDYLQHMILPAFTLACANIGALTRFISNMLSDELKKDYIKGARVRWLPGRKIVAHAMRNIRLPLYTYVSSSIPLLFSGAVIVESIFGIYGVGSMAYAAALSRDYPLLIGFTVLLAIIIILNNIITDVVCMLLDRRINING